MCYLLSIIFIVLFTTSKLHAQLADITFLNSPADIILGHYEVHIDYTVVPGAPDDGWRFSVSFDDDNDFNDNDGITRLDPSTVRIIAAPGAQQTIQSAALSRLGNIGAPVWILPQNNVSGTPFLGVRTIIEPDIFQASFNGFFFDSAIGSIILEMISVEGSGPDNGGKYAMWENGAFGTLEFHFDSSDGINASDRLEPVPIGSHAHYSWAMSRPGTYEVTFRALGKLNSWQPNGNQFTSGSATFIFVVPFSGYASGSAELRLSDSTTLPASIYDTRESCEYATNQVALEATENGSAHELRLNLVPDAQSAPNRVGIDGDVPVALPLSLQLSNAPLELLAANGPGNVSTVSGNNQVLFSFDETGIYRLQMRARLLDGLNSTVFGEPFTVTVLAGLPINYNYSVYADSFERQHGLNTGDLNDPFLDFDKDGVPNGVEYQLFWHGFDPVVADAYHMPPPTLENGSWGMTFLRDTYKDDFRLTATSLAADRSSDLKSWASWHTQTGSKPIVPDDTGAELKVFENGVGAESIGRIMKRRVESNQASDKAFYRFMLF